MTLGPLMVDLEGTTISETEREVLQHPLVGGVILFTRNYESVEQITELCTQIHQVRQESHLLISVDHEGGRVQRFRDGFTRLPALGVLGQAYQQDQQKALKQTEQMGWLMAAELRAVGVDFSFAPDLDLNYGVSEVIGNRAFERDPHVVIQLAKSYIQGMKQASMMAVGKHFPGHGAVDIDSHVGLPVDERHFEDIFEADMLPFRTLCDNELAGVMPAHIIYSQCDKMTAGFSPYWLQTVLRHKLGFQGAIFSDDLSMEGAAVVGGPLERVEAALAAGCDMVLVCNNPGSVATVLDGLKVETDPARHARLVRLHGRHTLSISELQQTEQWKQAVNTAAILQPELEMELSFE